MNMEKFNYQTLLSQLFYQKEKKCIDRYVQSKGKIYSIKEGKAYEFLFLINKYLPLPWMRELRVAKHPKENVYAYASYTPSCKNQDASFICLYKENMLSVFQYHLLDFYPNHGFDIKPAFSPNGEWLAFVSTKKYGMINLVGDILVVPYKSNGKDVINLTQDLSISGVCREFQWQNDSCILVEYSEKGYSKVCSLSFDPSSPNSVVNMNVLGNYKLFNWMERGDDKYSQSFDFSTENGVDLSFLNKGCVELCEYSTTDGIISYYWFAHPNPTYNNDRTLLLCQGGPHHAWEPEIECGTYHIPFLQHLGYSIIMPIVRGMPGISQEFDEQVRGDWGGQCIKDYLSALDAAIKDHELDKNNVAVLGHSFGGFCAYSMNVQYPERFRCVVSESGPFDLQIFLSDCLKDGPTKGSVKNQTMVCEMYNGLANPQGNKVAEKMIREQSPHNLIKNCKDRFKPIIIIHGEDDKIVPFKQAEEAQKRFGCDLISYKGEGHVIEKKVENKRDRYLRILEFLDTHMT